MFERIPLLSPRRTQRDLDTGDHYAFTFTRAGVCSYFCSIHPKMVAKLVVK